MLLERVPGRVATTRWSESEPGCLKAILDTGPAYVSQFRTDIHVTPTHYNFLVGGPPNTPDKSLERWIVWQDGTNLEVISFARIVIAKWDELFLKHGIGA